MIARIAKKEIQYLDCKGVYTLQGVRLVLKVWKVAGNILLISVLDIVHAHFLLFLNLDYFCSHLTFH